MADVSIVIPTWNRARLLENCLASIKRHKCGNLAEVIVVDNGSSDDTRDVCDRYETTTIVFQENNGFAKACNEGALISASPYVLFLNNDCLVTAGWLNLLVSVLENENDVAVVQPKLVYPNGRIQCAGVSTYYNPHGLLAWKNKWKGKPSNFPPANAKHYGKCLTGACLLIRKHVFGDVCGFDESFWNNHEDIDLCFKIIEVGWKLVYEPASTVIHLGSQSGWERKRKTKANYQICHNRWHGRMEPEFANLEEAEGTQ